MTATCLSTPHMTQLPTLFFTIQTVSCYYFLFHILPDGIIISEHPQPFPSILTLLHHTYYSSLSVSFPLHNQMFVHKSVRIFLRGAWAGNSLGKLSVRYFDKETPALLFARRLSSNFSMNCGVTNNLAHISVTISAIIISRDEER